MGSVNKIIKKAPDLIQRVYYGTVPFKWRYSKTFNKTYQFLMESKNWNRQRLLDYQYCELKRLLCHSYKNVPYYTRVMNERGLTPDSFKCVEDLTLLPYLDKDTIRKNLQDLVATNTSEKSIEFRTSGSTGKKLVFYGSDSLYKKEAAFVLRAFHDHGATMYDKPSVWLRRYVPKTSASSLYYYDHELRRLYMSAYHLNEQTIQLYVNKISSGKYHTLVGYPSSIYVLACLCEENSLQISNIKAIHVASEKMLDSWKQKINSVFSIEPKAHYGLQERVSFHHQTSESSNYVENLEYGVTEFDSTDQENVIVGTGFLNYHMPFIRYRTNDTAKLNNNKREDRNPDTILDINGRCDDIIISSDGSRLPGVNFYTMMYKIDGVQMFQIYQHKNNSIEFNLVPNEKFSDQTIEDVKSGLSQRIGNLPIEIQVVSEIKRSRTTGKVRSIFRESDV